MYKNILLCLDNSDYSTTATDFALSIAGSNLATVTGVHVYAAKLHDSRFAEMESGLPERYQNPAELSRQRDIHDDLITKGLLTISDSYMDVFTKRAAGTGITTKTKNLEGRNFDKIVEESRKGAYGLIALGALGLGATKRSRTGSVTRRVTRFAATDVLIARDTEFNPDKLKTSRRKIAVAIDGSPHSFGALKRALQLGRVYSCRVEAISAFDPDFHYTAFRSIAGVLSEEAGKVFRFKEQEVLHKEIIDSGLEQIYQRHLDTASLIAKSEGIEITTKLFSGKATDQISKYVEEAEPFLLVMGKTGLHATGPLDIGNVTEECLNYSACNLLITVEKFTPLPATTDTGIRPEESAPRPAWSLEAKEVLNKIPSFARSMAANMVEKSAINEGVGQISADFIYKVRKRTGL